MSLDQRHLQLRQQLDALGFNQPLPIGALGLVSALLDDLIQTTESLKEAKDDINMLMQAKSAWDLGVEPYKCDNARLLAEVNSLHLEMLKKQDDFELETAALRVKIRNMKHSLGTLEEHNAELQAKVRELENKCGESEKSRKNGLNYNRRPFCSAVRSGGYHFAPLDLRGAGDGPSGLKCKCSCSGVRQNDVLLEVEKLQVEVKNQNEAVEVLKKQLVARDSEIRRLSTLLNGGRPAAALAADCCYRNVVKLSDDVEYLQAQKIELERKLTGRSVQEGDVMRKMIKMAELNRKLEQDLRDLEKVALNLESKANETVLEKDRDIANLRRSLEEANRKVSDLERGTYKYESSEYFNLKKALQDLTDEKRHLTKRLNEAKFEEKSAKSEAEKLRQKVLSLRSKVLTPPEDFELEKLREEKDYYFQEYSKLLETSRESLERAEKKHTLELAEKNLEIASLKSHINEMRRFPVEPQMTSLPVHCHSTTPSFHRLERERDVALALKEQALAERDRIMDKLNGAAEVASRLEHNHRMEVEELKNQVHKLESENRALSANQRPSSATINHLKTENRQLAEKCSSLEESSSQLRISLNQTKLLLEQTERAMVEQREKLTHSEHHKTHSEQVLHKLEKEHTSTSCELTTLKSELAITKASKAGLEKEKDRLIEDLDRKTEKIYALESDFDIMRATKRGLEDTISRLQLQLNSINTENVHTRAQSKHSDDEIGALRQQLVTLKRTSDNALNENCRLANELADTVAELAKERQNTKKAVDDREQLKKEIQQYVLEVERVNALLAEKESEMFGIATSYQSAAQDAESLGRARNQLQTETQEVRKALREALDEVDDLKTALKVKTDAVESCERQISALSAQISSLEEENERLEQQGVTFEKKMAEIRSEKEKLERQVTEKRLSSPQTSENSSLQELLLQKTSECDQIRQSATQMSQEVVRLKCRIDELSEKLDEEHAVAVKSEALAKEYKVQVQELRRLLTEDRFTQLRSMEDHNPYPTL